MFWESWEGKLWTTGTVLYSRDRKRLTRLILLASATILHHHQGPVNRTIGLRTIADCGIHDGRRTGELAAFSAIRTPQSLIMLPWTSREYGLLARRAGRGLR